VPRTLRLHVSRMRLLILGAVLCAFALAIGAHPYRAAAASGTPNLAHASARAGASASRRRCSTSATHHKRRGTSKACAPKGATRHTIKLRDQRPPIDSSKPIGTPSSSTGTSGSRESSERQSEADLPEESKPVGHPSAPAEAVPLAGTEAPFRLFSPTSFWNQELPSNAPLDPTSAAVMRAFNEQLDQENTAKGGPANINTTAWSVPVYTVPANQPMVVVKLDETAETLTLRALQGAWDEVPLPANAQPAAGTDKHLVVWQPSSDRLWEFWRLEDTPEGWQAARGGAIQNASRTSGAYGPEDWPNAKSSWGASASGLSIAGGLITIEDLELGQINHALALGIPNPRSSVYSSPAERTDGASTEPLSLPEGAHLRLGPNLNLAALHLPHLTMMLAEAAQRYGIIIRDTAKDITFYAQDPIPTGREPYTGPTGFFEKKSPRELLASFPWSHLQLLKLELHDNP
jgi:hypothetical protein